VEEIEWIETGSVIENAVGTALEIGAIETTGIGTGTGTGIEIEIVIVIVTVTGSAIVIVEVLADDTFWELFIFEYDFWNLYFLSFYGMMGFV
jgi:hypothetical protein